MTMRSILAWGVIRWWMYCITLKTNLHNIVQNVINVVLNDNLEKYGLDIVLESYQKDE